MATYYTDQIWPKVTQNVNKQNDYTSEQIKWLASPYRATALVNTKAIPSFSES
mgnify:CR=1 FL=1